MFILNLSLFFLFLQGLTITSLTSDKTKSFKSCFNKFGSQEYFIPAECYNLLIKFDLISSIISKEESNLIISNSTNYQQLDSLFNHLFQKHHQNLSYILIDIYHQSTLKQILFDLFKNQLNYSIESNLFINYFINLFTDSNLINLISQIINDIKMKEVEQINFTKLFCNLILTKIDFVSYLNENFSKFKIFPLINYQTFIEFISQSEDLTKVENNYQTLLLLFIFNYSTKDNISSFPFNFLNNLFISNFTFISNFQIKIQSLFEKKLFEFHSNSEDELYFIIFSTLLINQNQDFYSLFKISKIFTEIQIILKNFTTNLLTYFFNLYIQLSSELLPQILSSFLLYLLNLNYSKYSSSFPTFIKKQLHP
jgi:hypothetical protein